MLTKSVKKVAAGAVFSVFAAARLKIFDPAGAFFLLTFGVFSKNKTLFLILYHIFL